MSNNSYPALEALLKDYSSRSSSEKPVAVFDCDGTIIRGDIGEAMFYYQLEHFLFRTSPANIWLDYPKGEKLNKPLRSSLKLSFKKRKQRSRFTTFAEMMLSWYFDRLDDGKTEKACSDIVRLFAGFHHSEVEQIATATLRHQLESPLTQKIIGRHSIPEGIRYIREPLQLFERLRKLGFDIWVVSGSNQWSVDAVFRRFDLPADHIIGIDLEKLNDTFSAKVKTPVPVLENKIRALEERAVQQPVIVVSDSIYDIPLFQYCEGIKVLVRSGTEDSDDFFTKGCIVQDDSWVIIEEPSYEP
jgi:phosphoserine phosphatase